MVRVGVAELHDEQFVPFQIDYISPEVLGHHYFLGNLTRESSPPSRAEGLWRTILAHHLDRVGGRHDAGVWKPLEKGAIAKPMVSMAMRNVDRRLDLVRRGDPVLDVVRRHELVASDGEHIDGHRLEAPTGGTSAEELTHRSAGRFAAHDHAIARDHDVGDTPGQVWDARADLLEHFRERLAR